MSKQEVPRGGLSSASDLTLAGAVSGLGANLERPRSGFGRVAPRSETLGQARCLGHTLQRGAPGLGGGWGNVAAPFCGPVERILLCGMCSNMLLSFKHGIAWTTRGSGPDGSDVGMWGCGDVGKKRRFCSFLSPSRFCSVRAPPCSSSLPPTTHRFPCPLPAWWASTRLTGTLVEMGLSPLEGEEGLLGRPQSFCPTRLLTTDGGQGH